MENSLGTSLLRLEQNSSEQRPLLPVTDAYVPLSKSQKKTRFLWTHQDWGHILFTDELRFSIQSDSRQIVIWREHDSHYHS
ncbi:hypothetical protein AVEN_273239-1 [Araneus ventricosus]|uniref:Uncharacterized protein n=1 Tax=Araneus ventricosus TaxID=182803 RepID=A0A4Y2VYG1_ARAVE|nr:hypothetical protein AVEN_273239-1 [Araneus ventricosus]